MGDDPTLLANFFKIEKTDFSQIHRYTLDIKKVLSDKECEEDEKKKKAASQNNTTFKPRGISARVKKRIIFLLVKTFDNAHSIATDFSSKMYTLEPLKRRGLPVQPAQTLNPARIVYYDDEEPVAYTGTCFDIYVTMDILPLSNIQDQGGEITSALNVILSHRPNQLTIRSVADCRSASVTNIGANKFYDIEARATPLPNNIGLEARPGFFRSVNSSEVGLLLNINNATSAFYRPQNLAAAVRGAFPDRNNWVDKRGAIESWVKGLRVRTKYLKNSGMANGQGPTPEKTYTITGFPVTQPANAVPTPNTVFFTPEGATGQRSVLQHFQGGSYPSMPILIPC